MSYFLPVPDQIGIEQTKQLYKERLGKELSDEEAADALGRVMRYLYPISDLADKPHGETPAPTEP